MNPDHLGHIYVARLDEDGPMIKVGFTCRPVTSRLRSLGRKGTVHLVASRTGTWSDEHCLHQALIAHRVLRWERYADSAAFWTDLVEAWRHLPMRSDEPSFTIRDHLLMHDADAERVAS